MVGGTNVGGGTIPSLLPVRYVLPFMGQALIRFSRWCMEPASPLLMESVPFWFVARVWHLEDHFDGWKWQILTFFVAAGGGMDFSLGDSLPVTLMGMCMSDCCEK